MTKRKLMLGLQTVEDDGLLVHDKVYPEKQYVFTSPRGFYEWLCQQMGVNAKPDSPVDRERVVVDPLRLTRLDRVEAAAYRVVEANGSISSLRDLEDALR